MSADVKLTELNRALKLEEDALLTCVHCGLCLPHCPTYGVAGNENDSPRGRLWLMRAVSDGKLVYNERYTEHLDACIGCRACETVCPSGVGYGHLLGIARSDLREKHHDSLNAVGRFIRWSALKFVLPHQFVIRVMNIPMNVMRRLRPSGGWPSFLPRFVRVGLEMLPPPPRKMPHPETVRSRNGSRGKVIQFRGCLMDEMFKDVNHATTRILKVNGWDVDMPSNQTCCGALHDHAGDREHARVLARKNIDALEDGSGTPIIVNAAGCGAMLKEYGDLLADEPRYAERAKTFSARIKDATEFLAAEGVVSGAPVPYTVTYDAPCHLYHAQKVKDAPIKLLRTIPDVNFVPLHDFERCCGSGGIYNLTNPEFADPILADKVANIRDTKANVVVTANPGCQMQILAGVRDEHMAVEVRHVLDLLDESYMTAGLYD